MRKSLICSYEAVGPISCYVSFLVIWVQKYQRLDVLSEIEWN
jgi:hypothetical protein